MRANERTIIARPLFRRRTRQHNVSDISPRHFVIAGFVLSNKQKNSECGEGVRSNLPTRDIAVRAQRARATSLRLLAFVFVGVCIGVVALEFALVCENIRNDAPRTSSRGVRTSEIDTVVAVADDDPTDAACKILTRNLSVVCLFVFVGCFRCDSWKRCFDVL